MITKIDIAKFGLFSNFQWDNEIGKQEIFRRINIIYGKNYAGKTTLSRIFKCIEDKKSHLNYQDSKFRFIFSNDKVVSNADISAGLTDFTIRVYNSDFVKENLSWLRRDDGTINPFTILGTKNIEIVQKIEVITNKLGTIERQTGYLWQKQLLEQDFNKKKAVFEKEQEKLTEKLRSKAKEIKSNTFVYNYPTYQITTLKNDIPKAIKQGELSEEDILAGQKLLKEEPKKPLERLREAKPSFQNYYNEVRNLLKRKVQPSQSISELINDSLLQEWVRQGIDKHK